MDKGGLNGRKGDMKTVVEILLVVAIIGWVFAMHWHFNLAPFKGIVEFIQHLM